MSLLGDFLVLQDYNSCRRRRIPADPQASDRGAVLADTHALTFGLASSSPNLLTNKAFFMPGCTGCSSSMTAHAIASFVPSALNDSEAIEAGYFGS